MDEDGKPDVAPRISTNSFPARWLSKHQEDAAGEGQKPGEQAPPSQRQVVNEDDKKVDPAVG